MKKILFLINTLCGGGAEKVLVDIVNNLDKSKYDITVQTIIDDGVHKDNLEEHVKYKSIINTKNVLLKKIIAYLVDFIIPPRLTYKLCIKKDYDIEIAFLEGIPTKLLSASKNKNKIAWVHTDLVNNYGHDKTFKTVSKHANCYRKYNKIVCVSNTTKEAFRTKFGFDDNVIVQYNFVDENAIYEKSNENISEIEISDKFMILSVGRLSYEKGYDRLLNVHRRLIKEGYNCQLCIVGEGEKREEFENYINDNNLSGSVKIIGFNSNPYKFMKKADVYVCSSRAEGFPLVVVEALNCGCPIVSTDCAGPNEMLGDSEYGILVKNNEEALYEGVKLLMDNENLRNYYNVKAIERGKMFNKQKTIKEIELLFDEV